MGLVGVEEWDGPVVAVMGAVPNSLPLIPLHLPAHPFISLLLRTHSP